VPAPTVSTTSSGVATPGAVAAVAAVAVPALLTSVRIPASVVAGVATVPTGGAGISQAITPAVVATAAAVAQPVIRSSATIAATTIAATAAVLTPFLVPQIPIGVLTSSITTTATFTSSTTRAGGPT